LAKRAAESRSRQRAALAGAGKVQAVEWIDGAIQREAGAATSCGGPGFARRKRCESGGPSGAGEHDGADAAAGNDDAFGAANCRSRRGSGRDIKFWIGGGHDGNLRALAYTKFFGGAGIAGGRGIASEFSEGRIGTGTFGAADQHRAGKR